MEAVDWQETGVAIAEGFGEQYTLTSATEPLDQANPFWSRSSCFSLCPYPLETKASTDDSALCVTAG